MSRMEDFEPKRQLEPMATDKAPGILLERGRGGILEEVTYGICSGGEWEVWFRGDEGREAQYGGEDNHKERGIIGFAGAKYALDAE